MNSSRFFLILTTLVVLNFSAGAQALEWEEKEVTIEAVEGGGRASTELRFKNISKKPVRIRKVPISCSCTVAKLEKRVYAPGESGTIPLTYSPKRRWGKRAYRIFVVTDEKGTSPYAFKLIVDERRRKQTKD